MKNFILVILCILLLPAVALAEPEITASQHATAMEALLIYTGHNMHPDAQLFTVGYIPLATKEDAGYFYIWASVMNNSYLVANKAVRSISGGAIPACIVMKQDSEGMYQIEDVRFPRPGGFFSEDIADLFPKEIQARAIDYPKDTDELEERNMKQAQAYLTHPTKRGEAGWLLESLSDNGNTRARNVVRSAFPDYPFYEGEAVWGYTNHEMYRYSLYTGGEHSYNGTLTFEKSTLDGQLLERAVVRVENGELKLLEGKLPQSH